MFSKTTLGAIALALLKVASAQENYIITFGDSYSDCGFDINGERPSSNNPIGNPSFPGWPSSGGANWIGSLITEHNNGLVLSYSYAMGGAVVNKDLTTESAREPRSFSEQVQSFASTSGSFGWNRDNTIAGIWFGVNDISTSYQRPDSTDLNSRIAQSYFEQLQILYNLGIRHFVLLGAPPIERTPLMIQQGAGEILRSALLDFIGKIQGGVAGFVANNPEADVKFIDTQPAFFSVIEHGAEFGAPDVFCTVLENDPNCIWY